MATKENTYFLRCFLLLSEGGLYISREILERESQIAGGNLDALLHQSKLKLKHEFHGKQYDKLFPQYGTTDITKWDLQMLVGVLIYVFGHSLSATEKHSLRALRDMRNMIYMDCVSATLDKERYEETQEELQNIITTLAQFFDEPVRDHCFRLVTKFATGSLDVVSRCNRRYEAFQHDSGSADLLEEETEFDSFSASMADKYYRLMSFLVNICPQPLRKLFLKYMNADPTRAPTCTTLDAYLASRKPQLQVLQRRKLIRQDQWQLLFPRTAQVDESLWDTTLVVLLLNEFFKMQLLNLEHDAIQDIRRIQNRVQHMAETSIADADFDGMWTILENATIDLAKQIEPSPAYADTIKKHIDGTKINNMPKLGDSLRDWYEHIIMQLKSEIEDMKEIMTEMSEHTADNAKYTREGRTILQESSVQKVCPSGDKVKRMKIVDQILAKLNNNFITTIKEDLPTSFDSPPEVVDIKTKLRDVHHVIVTGYRGSRYLETALAAIHDMDYNHYRCVEMRGSSDWRHIDPEEVDLVLCREPFGDYTFDEKRTRDMADIFNSMLWTANASDGSKHLDIVIVSETEVLKHVSNVHEHDLLEEVVKVYQHTTKKESADLTNTYKDFEGDVSTCTENILDDKMKRMKTVDQILAKLKNNFITTMKEDLPTSFDSLPEVTDVKSKLRDVHHVVVTGYRDSCYLETALAAIHDIGYNQNRCVEMRGSSDWRHIDPEEVDLVLCREPFGDYTFDEKRTKSMADIFNNMLRTANASDGSKHLDIVIVSEIVVLQHVSKVHEHDLLEEVIKVYHPTTEKEPADLTNTYKEFEGDVSSSTENLLDTLLSMKKGELPDQRLLNEVCLELGRKSKLLIDLCQNISEHIKAMDENILHVWAAYTVKERNKITFVVVVKENIPLENTIKYSFIKRVVNQYSLEAEHVMYNNKEVSIDQHDVQRLKTSISNHATELMRRHKYLSIISGSSVRSRNYGNDQSKAVDLVAQACIVLYVHTKHFIPIDEEPFEELYNDVPVDVREGEFFPYVLATDRHDTLKHSCQIGSSPDRSPNDHNRLAGSLGCFIDHPEYNLCGLTCAHVLLFPWGLEAVKRDENGTLRWPSFRPHDKVYQPAESNEVIGQIVQVIYQEGGNTTCGMEVALFQIDQRHPICGRFPTMRNAEGDEEIVFDSGKSCGFSHIRDDEAIKFGPVTDKTTGKFEIETHSTSVRTISEYWDNQQFRITLNNQLCVKATDSNGQPKHFAAEGDSGSLVFIKDSCGELVTVGIVEGGTSYGATIVTPIKPILQRIGVHSIKSFEKEKIEQKLDNIDNRLKNVQSTIDASIQRNLDGFKTTFFTDVTEYIEKKLGGNK